MYFKNVFSDIISNFILWGEKMKKKFKSICSIFLCAVLLACACAFSAYADTTDSVASDYVRISFYKPDSWGNNLYIHLWNAGSENTQWPGVAINNTNSHYYYSNYNISSCDFVIHDGNGNQTSDLHADGQVGVKDNHVFAVSNHDIPLRFKAPANWSSNIYVYYYSNDTNQVALTPWPGKAMTVNNTKDGYHTFISDMADIRVLFTDGTHQYPASGQPGIAVSAGQQLIFDQNKYTVNEYDWYHLNQPTTCAFTGQDYTVSYDFDSSHYQDLSFRDQNGAHVMPVSEINVRNNDIITTKYTFNFSEPGTKILSTYYTDHSSTSKLDKDLKINVIEPDVLSSYNAFSDKYDVNLGDTFTITASDFSTAFYYRFRDSAGNVIQYDRSYSTTINGKPYKNYVFTADKLGQYQVLDVNIVSSRDPIHDTNTAKIMINVWKAAQ